VRAAFAPGDAVIVDKRDQPGHVRTPWYIRGKTGRVVERVRAFPNPEELAEGRTGVPYRMLYRVLLRQAEVWPDYAGPATDTLVVDIYEHWLRGRDP
jgi:nitrile hydratase